MKKFYVKFIKSKKDVKKLAKHIMKNYCKIHHITENQEDAICYDIESSNDQFTLKFIITKPDENAISMIFPRKSIAVFMTKQFPIIPIILKNPTDHSPMNFDDISEPSLETLERILYSARRVLLVPNDEIPDSDFIDTLPVTKQLILSQFVNLFLVQETNKRIVWNDFTIVSSKIEKNKDDEYTLNLQLSYGAEFINIRGVDINLVINFNVLDNCSLHVLSVIIQIENKEYQLNHPEDIFPIVDLLYKKYQTFYRKRGYDLSKNLNEKEKEMVTNLRKQNDRFVKVKNVFELLRTPNESYMVIEESNWYSGEYLEVRNCDVLDVFNKIRLDNTDIDDETRSVLDMISENTNLFEYFLRIIFTKDYIMPKFDDIDGYMMLKLK